VRFEIDAQKDFVIVEGHCSGNIGVVASSRRACCRNFTARQSSLWRNGEMRGSSRSFAGFDSASALRECDEFLVRPRRTRDGGGLEHFAGEN